MRKLFLQRSKRYGVSTTSLRARRQCGAAPRASHAQKRGARRQTARRRQSAHELEMIFKECRSPESHHRICIRMGCMQHLQKRKCPRPLCRLPRPQSQNPFRTGRIYWSKYSTATASFFRSLCTVSFNTSPPMTAKAHKKPYRASCYYSIGSIFFLSSLTEYL